MRQCHLDNDLRPKTKESTISKTVVDSFVFQSDYIFLHDNKTDDPICLKNDI